VKTNKIRANYEKQKYRKFLYQVVYDDTPNADSTHCMTVVYGTKYVYKSTLDSQAGNRLIFVTNNNPLLTSSCLSFTLQTQQDEVVPSDQHNIDIDEMDNESQIRCII